MTDTLTIDEAVKDLIDSLIDVERLAYDIRLTLKRERAIHNKIHELGHESTKSD